MRVALDVVCLARLGVGVEDEVNSSVLLKLKSAHGYKLRRSELAFAAKAMHLETKAPDFPSRVVIIPNLQAVTNSDKSSTFSLIDVSSLFFSL